MDEEVSFFGEKSMDDLVKSYFKRNSIVHSVVIEEEHFTVRVVKDLVEICKCIGIEIKNDDYTEAFIMETVRKIKNEIYTRNQNSENIVKKENNRTEENNLNDKNKIKDDNHLYELKDENNSNNKNLAENENNLFEIKDQCKLNALTSNNQDLCELKDEYKLKDLSNLFEIKDECLLKDKNDFFEMKDELNKENEVKATDNNCKIKPLINLNENLKFSDAMNKTSEGWYKFIERGDFFKQEKDDLNENAQKIKEGEEIYSKYEETCENRKRLKINDYPSESVKTLDNKEEINTKVSSEAAFDNEIKDFKAQLERMVKIEMSLREQVDELQEKLNMEIKLQQFYQTQLDELNKQQRVDQNPFWTESIEKIKVSNDLIAKAYDREKNENKEKIKTLLKEKKIYEHKIDDLEAVVDGLTKKIHKMKEKKIDDEMGYDNKY